MGDEFVGSKWSKRADSAEVMRLHIDIGFKETSLAQTDLECELGIAYGLKTKEKLDIYGAQTLPKGVPTYVFIHGGMWQEMGVIHMENMKGVLPFHNRREYYGYIITPVVKAGAVAIVIGYEMAPEVKMDEIVDSVKQAMVFILNFAKRRDSCGVYICGHSSGGHLAALMLATDWLQETMSSNNIIKGAILVSGLFDLSTIYQLDDMSALNLTRETAERYSPLFMIKQFAKLNKDRDIRIVMAEHDASGFRDQNIEFHKALKSEGLDVSLIDADGFDHFDIVENLKFDTHFLTKIILDMMGLNIDELLQNMKATDVS